MKKVIVSIEGDMLTEHWGKTFEEVLNTVSEKSELYLDWYQENRIGLVFVKRTFIGKKSNHLTKEDYFVAYDK